MSRIIKFRAWDIKLKFYLMLDDHQLFLNNDGLYERHTVDYMGDEYRNVTDKYILEQFTGLLDKNGLTELYEGDIIGENGIKKGNIHESPQIYEERIDCIIKGMGTKAWRSTESVAMGRGCRYSE